MKKRTNLKTRIAEALCELNCWRTPEAIRQGYGRNLTEEETQLAFEILECFVPVSEWGRVWRAQDAGKKYHLK